MPGPQWAEIAPTWAFALRVSIGRDSAFYASMAG
jgi:hypothetical protein